MLTINTKERQVIRDNQVIQLTKTEFALFNVLYENSPTPVSAEQLHQKVWGLDFDPGTNRLRVYLNFLKRKIDHPFPTEIIHNKRGEGWYLAQKLVFQKPIGPDSDGDIIEWGGVKCPKKIPITTEFSNSIRDLIGFAEPNKSDKEIEIQVRPDKMPAMAQNTVSIGFKIIESEIVDDTRIIKKIKILSASPMAKHLIP